LLDRRDFRWWPSPFSLSLGFAYPSSTFKRSFLSLDYLVNFSLPFFLFFYDHNRVLLPLPSLVEQKCNEFLLLFLVSRIWQSEPPRGMPVERSLFFFFFSLGVQYVWTLLPPHVNELGNLTGDFLVSALPLPARLRPGGGVKTFFPCLMTQSYFRPSVLETFNGLSSVLRPPSESLLFSALPNSLDRVVPLNPKHLSHSRGGADVMFSV